MIGQGVSSRSSHSATAGRTTRSAKPCTQSRTSRWSSVSSSENAAVSAVTAMGLSLASSSPRILPSMPTSAIQKHSSASQISGVPWDDLPAHTAAALRPRLEQTVDEVIEAIRTGVPAYAEPLEGAFGEGLRTAVADALSRFLDKVEGK